MIATRSCPGKTVNGKQQCMELAASTMLTCPELNFCSRLASDKVLQVLHSQDEGLNLGARSDTSLPTAHGAVPAGVVKQQHLPYELPRTPHRYNGP